MIVGVALGPVALGQIKIARRIFDFVAQLTILPLSNVAQAAFPHLIGKGVDGGDELRAVYKRVQGVCALGVLPLFAGLAMTAPLWVPLALGEKWRPAIGLIQWISLSSVSAVVNYFQLPLLVAFRRNRLILRQNIARILTTVGLTAIGVLGGLTFVIQLSLIQAYGFTVYNWIVTRRIAGWDWRDNIANLVPAAVATAGMSVALLLFQDAVQFEAQWMQLAAMVAVGVASYAVILFAAFRRKSMRMVGEIAGLLSRRGRATAQAAAGSI
jgi:PST family polysaccharide transporter